MATHLKAEEREVVSQMLASGATRKAIAERLGRDRSTIYRELRRNGLRGLYCAVHAQACAVRRRRAARAKSRKLCRCENLAYVQERLRRCWSPDQIAGRSRVDFPADSRRKLSRQTIYTWLHRDDHRRRWVVFLRHYRRKRRRAALDLPQARSVAGPLAPLVDARPRNRIRRIHPVGTSLGAAGLLCRSALTLAAWHEREYQWLNAPVLSQRHPPEARQSIPSGTGREVAQRSAAKTTPLSNPQRNPRPSMLSCNPNLTRPKA